MGLLFAVLEHRKQLAQRQQPTWPGWSREALHGWSEYLQVGAAEAC